MAELYPFIGRQTFFSPHAAKSYEMLRWSTANAFHMQRGLVSKCPDDAGPVASQTTSEGIFLAAAE